MLVQFGRPNSGRIAESYFSVRWEWALACVGSWALCRWKQGILIYGMSPWKTKGPLYSLTKWQLALLVYACEYCKFTKKLIHKLDKCMKQNNLEGFKENENECLRNAFVYVGFLLLQANANLRPCPFLTKLNCINWIVHIIWAIAWYFVNTKMHCKFAKLVTCRTYIYARLLLLSKLSCFFVCL